jgi:hypothetical protein
LGHTLAPHIRINNVYVNNVYRNVAPNRCVLDRHVNYGALERYNSVHRGVDYSNVRRARNDAGRRTDTGPRPVPATPGTPHQDNKIIRRSMDPNDPRIDANRGRGKLPQSQPPVRQAEVPRPEARALTFSNRKSVSRIFPGVKDDALIQRNRSHTQLCPCRYPGQIQLLSSNASQMYNVNRNRFLEEEAAVAVVVHLTHVRPAGAVRRVASSRIARLHRLRLQGNKPHSNMSRIHSKASRASDAAGGANETAGTDQSSET